MVFASSVLISTSCLSCSDQNAKSSPFQTLRQSEFQMTQVLPKGLMRSLHSDLKEVGGGQKNKGGSGGVFLAATHSPTPYQLPYDPAVFCGLGNFWMRASKIFHPLLYSPDARAGPG